MKPSDYLKRICAVVLALTMLSGIVSANLVGVVLAEPDTEPVETSAPETEAPETEAPETEAPETEAPETEAPETEAPETEAPETEAPETEAPETEAPETEAHENEAPETEAPEAEAHENEVPETEAPETEAPVLDPEAEKLAALQAEGWLLWSGEQNGGTLTKNVILAGDTKMTSLIVVQKGTNIIIDLNGYMLQGSGNGNIISNNGTLTIRDSRPDHGSHRFRSSTTGPWELDEENGDQVIIGGIITGGRDTTNPNAGQSGGGAIKQGALSVKEVLYIEGGTLVGNSTRRAGGAVYGGAITMTGGAVIGNYAGAFGGGLSLSGSFVLTGGVIRDNETSSTSDKNNPNSTAFYDNADVIIGQSSSFTMTGGELIGNLCTVTSSSGTPTFSMTGGRVEGRFRILNGLEATLSGGELYGSIYIKNGGCTVSDNMKIHGGTNSNGGSVYIIGGNVTMNGGTIYDSVGVKGGAIYISNGSFNMNGGEIRNCKAAQGGAVYVTKGSKAGSVKLNGGVIDGCYTEADTNSAGGAIYVTGGNVTMTGGTIKNCYTARPGDEAYSDRINGFGGALYITDGSMKMTGGTIIGNEATQGGGVYLTGGSFTLNGEDAYISYNSAQLGGGVYLTKINPTLLKGNITNNVAASSGGGIYIDKQVVKLSPTGTVLFEKNKATDGAGMYIQGEETKPAGFSVDDTALGSVEFSGNTATSNGGGVCLSYGDMVITNEQILLYGNEAQNGGGAAILNGNFTLSGGSIGVGEKNVNYAVNGGGIYVDGGNVTVSGTGTITNNNAQNGGGVYLSGGKFTLNGEQAYIKENSADNGGGVYLTEINPFLLAGNIVKNTATYNGGGIFIDRQVVELEPTGTVLFDENKATDGAGMYIRGEEAQPAGFTVKECSGKVVFKRNVATTSGGGVCVNNGSFTIGYDNIDIIENTAVNGGGIAVLSGNFNMNAGSIGTLGGANTATNGGGIYVAGGTATLGNCLVTYNTAVNGGGAYVSGGNLILNDGGSFIANSAVPNAGESANGGGFYVKGGSFTMNNGTVSKNSSSDGNGGGGYIDGGNFIMKNGVIGGDTADQANTAVNGGGICVSDGNVTVYNGSIKYNKALSDGGGVYVSSQTMEVRVIILSGYLMKNSADSVGGGMAVRSESSQPITVEIGCLLLHDGYPFDYVGEKYGVYSEGGTHKHEFCPQVSGNVAGINGGGFYLDSSSAELYYYCIVEDPADPNIANGNTNCHGLDVEGGRIEIGDSGYHNHLADKEDFRDVLWGNVQLHSTILVNNGTVDIYGDMDNPYFGSKITVDIKDASGYFKDHRRSISNNDYKIHYFENFGGGGKYIANQYAVENGVCEVPITGAAFERSGYKIEGWNTEPDGKGVEYLVGSVYDLVQLGEADGMGADPSCKYCTTDSYCLILYAQWKKKGYVITYERNAPFGAVCTGDTPPQECTIGETAKLRPNGFICAGYKFLGWSEDQYAIIPDYPDEAEVIDLTLVDSSEVKLYAIWQKCAHIDTLAYEVSEDYEATIVEYCSACYGHIAYASLSATDETFDGNPHAATVSGDYNTPNWLGETPEVVYVKKEDPKWDDDDLDRVWETWGEEGSTEAPVHAGEYTASLTIDEETTVSCEFTISPVKWTTPEKPGYVDAKVGGKDGVLAQPPGSTVPGEAPKYEYRYQYLLDGTTYDFDWQDDEFIPTEHGNVFYYIYARAKADRDHIESDPSHFVLVLNGNAEVQWDIDLGIDVIEANIDGDNNLTFKAFAEENYHKRDWSVTLHTGSVYNPGTTITEQDGVYVLEALDTSDDVTYIVRITGVSLNANFEVKSTYDQVFDNFDNVTSFDISRDSSFTVQYTAKNYTPAEYGNEKDGYEALTFNKSAPEGVPADVPAGTKIIMVLNGEYWYTVLKSPKTTIPLTEFWKMGSAGSDRYTRTDGNSPVNMTWQFTFDFSEVDESSYPAGDSLEVTFGAPQKSESSEAPIFNLTENIGLVNCASFDLQCSGFTGNVATITYEYNKSNGHASIWQDRESALVITLSGTLPADLRLSTRLGQQTTLYSMSEGNQFIIPCGALTSGSNSIEIELISDLLGSVTEVTADVKWLVSASGADQSPLNGTEVGHVNRQIVVSMQPALLPALKIDRITQPNSPVLNELRLCKLDDDYSVDIRTVNLPEDWTVTLYLYRKDTTVGSATEGQFLYTGFYEVLDTSQNNIRSKLSLRGQEEGTFYLYVVATVGEDASRVIKSEDKYFFIAEE